MAAERLVTMQFKAPGRQLIPVAADQERTAARTPGARSVKIVNVACVDVVQSVLESYPARSLQGRRRRRGFVPHLPVRMKCREVQRYIRAQVFDYPPSHLVDFRLGVILARNQQYGNLEPDRGAASQQVPCRSLPGSGAWS